MAKSWIEKKIFQQYKKIILLYLVVILSSAVFAVPKHSSELSILKMKTSLYILEIQELYSNLNHPWGIAWHHASGISPVPLLVTERNGTVWILQKKTIKQIRNLPKDVLQVGQGGWFDIATTSDGTIYLSYAKGTYTNNRTALISFTLNSNDLKKNNNSIDAKNIIQVFEMNKPDKSSAHYGAVITIDETRRGSPVLYLGLGERANRYLAQDITNHHGTIVRIIKQNNTYNSKIVSYGHRNPQGIFFNVKNNLLYATEHGPLGGDELNLIEDGKNYGWPVISWGKEYGSKKQVGEGTKKAGMTQPIYKWIPISPALSGLTGYQGSIFIEWNGNLLASALKYQQIYRIVLDEKGRKVIEVETLLDKTIQRKIGRIRSIEQAPDHSIYIISDENNGKIFRLTPSL